MSIFIYILLPSMIYYVMIECGRQTLVCDPFV